VPAVHESNCPAELDANAEDRVDRTVFLELPVLWLEREEELHLNLSNASESRLNSRFNPHHAKTGLHSAASLDKPR
jgi:hypothetical protein